MKECQGGREREFFEEREMALLRGGAMGCLKRSEKEKNKKD